MRKVIGIGETILDIIFQNNQPQKAVPGGSTFNCMISLGRCGVPALFVSELGSDRVGEFIRSFMEENGLSADYVDFFTDGLSPVSLAFLDENQQAEYAFYRDFPKKRLQNSFPPIAENDIVIFGSYFAVNPTLRPKIREWLEYAQSQKAVIYYDINFRKAHIAERAELMADFIENFQYATIIRCSDEDLDVLFPNESVEALYERYFLPEQKILIVTQGEKGVWLKTPDLEKNYFVEKITPVSTIGAGDNFNAGFVYGLIQQDIDKEEISQLTENQWDILISLAQTFAKEVCLSMDNYINKRPQ
jgi:fructokinase